jgi:D-3-phosphoglycerate dehydrogenase
MRILFIDAVHPVLSERLAIAGHVCEDVSSLDGEELLVQLQGAEGIVIRGRIMLDKPKLDRATKLRFIARAGAGMENIDKAECERRGIRLYNSPEGNRDAVAEHAIAMLLGLMNHLVRADREVRGGKWRRKENTGHELHGSTVGIIGFGRMGRAFAERLTGFGVKILAYDKYLKDYAPDHVQEVELDAILEHCDVISLHLPLTEETDHYANAGLFASIRKPVWFVNTARGQLVDTNALLDAIDSGRVRGACLDTLEFEERSLLGLRPDAPKEVLQRLFKSEHVILSPHVAGITHESYFKLANVLADKVLNAIADGQL